MSSRSPSIGRLDQLIVTCGVAVGLAFAQPGRIYLEWLERRARRSGCSPCAGRAAIIHLLLTEPPE